MKLITSYRFFLVVLIFLSGQSVTAQLTKEAQIISIRKEYQKINKELGSYKKKEATWKPENSYDGSYMDHLKYTGYYNSSGQLVLLKYKRGEEGYWSLYEYYFKNNEIFFSFIHSGDPEGGETEERIYFWDKKIIQAYLKTKPVDNETRIEGNEVNDVFMKDVERQTEYFLLQVKDSIDKFKQALNK
jgi:hypothetical protein